MYKVMKHSIKSEQHENIAKYEGIIEVRGAIYLRREYVSGVPLRFLVISNKMTCVFIYRSKRQRNLTQIVFCMYFEKF